MSDRITSPSNTTREVQEFPLGFLAASLGSGGASGAIEEQERNGQAELLNSTTLPTDGSNSPELAALGFVFGDEVPGDPMFRQATLPEGWTREGSDHAMHSYVCDERGVRRVNVFYKAAFYDRRADLHVMNVGYDVSTKWIYGDGEPKPLRADLTADELADALAGAERYIRSAERSPDTYGHRLPRAKSLIAAIKAVG